MSIAQLQKLAVLNIINNEIDVLPEVIGSLHLLQVRLTTFKQIPNQQ